MADRGDTHYHTRHLNLWFAISSVVFLVATLWMVIDDWNRPWKRYQREFRGIETERAKESLATAEAQAALAEEERLTAVMAEREAALEARKAELDAAKEELRQLRGTQFTATEAAKQAKQEYNWERWRIEEERLSAGDPTLEQDVIEAFEDRLFEREGEKELADMAVAVQEDVIADLMADFSAVETEIKGATKDVDLIRKKLAGLDPEDAPTQIANLVRDFPGLDFIGPNLKVNKVVLEDLTFELNFTKKKRIDMCMTCHMSIDREGFVEEGLEQPHRSHPRLDLFLSAKSPHPMNEVGCTICHRGSGEALDFQRTDHRPSDAVERERWEDEYHWHKEHYWDYPMLSSRHVEASCVQCHKSSMELIAPEAPKVAEGYRLFERYGCYSCHKVEWFPTERRPGPTLAAIRQKTRKPFVDAWVRDPKAFRPTTWMPKIFHLENYGPEDVVATSEYGQGREMKGPEWSEAWLAAATAYVWDASSTDALPPIPVEGDAKRGREVFRLTGCLACHSMAPFTEEERDQVRDPAMRRRETNEHGPNLRGIATKVSAEWLYAWIKDPAAYWPETRMPDLRLDDQDAADIVAYVMEDPEGIFHDVPADWEERPVAYERDVLEEQARWLFNREGRAELARRFREEWADDQALLVAVGEKVILSQGCHSCHEIPGLENAMPIGTELTNWASKTVDKLDFGFMHEILADERGLEGSEHHHFTSWFKEYRENFLEQKLHAPRSFDRRKLKNPTEKLRMPWFDFTGEEIEALTTFVVGLVDDEVQRAKMVPTADQVAMDTGLRVLRQKNCAACHVVEPGLIDFMDEDGVHRSVEGQILTLEEDFLPPPLDGFQEYVAGFSERTREALEDDEFEVEEAIVQLLRPEPGLGDTGTTLVVDDVASIETRPAWGGDFVDVVVDYYQYPFYFDEDSEEDVSADPGNEGLVQDVDGEWRDYSGEPYDKVRWTFAPPVLLDEGAKLQREWFYEFLLDPVPLRPQVRVRMPSFHWAAGEAGAVADYFAHRARNTWPARYARKLLLALDTTPEEIAREMEDQGLPSASADQIQGIVDGAPVETEAAFDELLAYGNGKGFRLAARPDPAYEAIPQRTPSYLEAVQAEDPGHFDRVHTLLAEGPNCFQCHFLKSEPPTAEGPIAWAPDLDLTRERLRPEWVREWLEDPSLIYPGTAMPANFPADQQVWQELYPAPTPEQIEAVVAWLFNLDRVLVRN